MSKQAETKEPVEARKMAELAAQRDVLQATRSAELRAERDIVERAREEALLKERQRFELQRNVIEEPNQNRERELDVLRKIGEEKVKLEMERSRIVEEKAKMKQQKQLTFASKMAMLKRRLISLESEHNQERDRVQSWASNNLDIADQREVDQTHGEVTNSSSELRTENEERNEEVSQ